MKRTGLGRESLHVEPGARPGAWRGHIDRWRAIQREESNRVVGALTEAHDPNEPVIGRKARRGQRDVLRRQLPDVRAICVGHHQEVLGVVADDDAPEERELAT